MEKTLLASSAFLFNMHKQSTNPMKRKKKLKQTTLLKKEVKSVVKAPSTFHKKKRVGLKKGMTVVKTSREVAYALVKYYEDNQKMYKGVTDFLSREESNPLSRNHKQKFGLWRKEYKAGKLTASSTGYRNRKSKYECIEIELVKYIRGQEQKITVQIMLDSAGCS